MICFIIFHLLNFMWSFSKESYDILSSLFALFSGFEMIGVVVGAIVSSPEWFPIVKDYIKGFKK